MKEFTLYGIVLSLSEGNFDELIELLYWLIEDVTKQVDSVFKEDKLHEYVFNKFLDYYDIEELEKYLKYRKEVTND